MTKILSFIRPEGTRKRSAGNLQAEIVIFPGVRVEYHDQPPKPAGNGRSGPGRRRPAKRALSA